MCTASSNCNKEKLFSISSDSSRYGMYSYAYANTPAEHTDARKHAHTHARARTHTHTTHAYIPYRASRQIAVIQVGCSQGHLAFLARFFWVASQELAFTRKTPRLASVLSESSQFKGTAQPLRESWVLSLPGKWQPFRAPFEWRHSRRG